MDIPSGVIIMWPSTAGSIPAGWARETSLDGRFIVGTAADTNPNNYGGANTHIHSQPAHSHTGGSHTHTIPTYKRGTRSNGPYNLRWQQWDNAANGYVNTGYGPDPGSNEHTHGSGASGAGTNNLSSQGQSWVAGSNLPSYYETIFIKSDGSPSDFPNGSSTFWSTASLPEGWSLDSNVGDRFLRGASGSNSGATCGGSHSHNTSSHSHPLSHSHGGFSTNAAPPHEADPNGNYGTGMVGTCGCDTGNQYEAMHNHGTTPSLSGGGSSGGGGGAGSGNASPVPKYKKQIAIKNGSGSSDYPSDGGAICLWLGTLAAIPTDWYVCDGNNGTPDMRNYFATGTSSTGNVGASANANTSHNHSTSSHNHGGSHNHGNYGNSQYYNPLEWGSHSAIPGCGNSSGQGTSPPNALVDAAAVSHGDVGHIGGATGSGGGGSGGGTQSIVAYDETPAWRTVAFIFGPEDAAGGNTAMFGTNL